MTTRRADARPADARVLRHEVLDGLRSDIVSGRIAPGARLLEAPLAADLRISRGPIREAFRQLEQEGLVTFQPHRGATVVGVPEAEVETIYALRGELEAKAFARASLQISDEELVELESILAEMVAASKAGDVEAVMELDFRFHSVVMQASGFRFLRRLWTSMYGLVRWRTVMSIELLGLTRVKRGLLGPTLGHQDLVDSLRSRSPDRAAAAARHHIEEAMVRLAAQKR
jgi:DNA-binding GntR family transcriptional regulator